MIRKPRTKAAATNDIENRREKRGKAEVVRQSTQPSAEFLIVPRFAGEVKMDENGQELEPEQDITRKKIRNN